MVASLKSATGTAFVASFSALAPAVFRPEDTKIGDYAFVPWVRTGMAAAITAAPAGNRAVVTASVDVVDSSGAGTPRPVSRSLTLYGPGDVVAVDPAQIIRREPAGGTMDAEAGFLAHIEFARPDFPWLFSPYPAKDGRCPAWLALVVVEAAVSRIEPSQGELPARLRTQMGQLQPLAENDRFAHAQVVGAGMSGDNLVISGTAIESVETRLSEEHAPANLSRLMCPRRLDDGKTYIAALVPAYHCGVQAGLGLSGGTLAPAWTRSAGDAQTAVVLPVYDHWQFRTAPGGNFEELAARIRGRAAPWRVGRRMIDVSTPGGAIPSLPAGHAAGVQLLECALFSPADPPPGQTVPAPWPTEQREALRQRIDEANDTDPDLPRVGARLYARYQRAASRIGAVFGAAPFGPNATAAADGDWFSQLNTDPMLRIVAGLGARVVQKDQEPLMQAAWAQVEGIRRANQALVWAGMAETLNVSFSRRHLEPLETGRLAQVTRNLHGRLRIAASPRSLDAAIIDSRTSTASLETAFRRTTRPQGPLGKRAGLGDAGRLVADAAGFRDQRRMVGLPDGIASVSATGMRFFDPALVARRLGTRPEQALTQLGTRIRTLATGTAVRRLDTVSWAGPAAGAAGDILGEAILKDLGRLAGGGQVLTDVRAGALAEVALGLSQSGGGLAVRAGSEMKRLSALAPKADTAAVVDIRILPTGTAAGTIATGVTRPGAIQTGPNVLQPGAIPGPGGRVLRSGTTFGTTPGTMLNTGRNTTGPRITDTPRIEVPPEIRPELRFDSTLSRQMAQTVAELNRIGITAVRAQAAALVTGAALPPAADTDPGALTLTRGALLSAIEPRRNARLAFSGRLSTRPDMLRPGVIRPDWLDVWGLRPIMAAPEFRRPMYAALADYDRDWLVPGLGLIPDPDFITLLEINPGFAEAFLVGASDEMGRELLWRNYPTDQRGTYFKRFWDAEEDELTRQIHRFGRTPVGTHFSIGGNRQNGAGALAVVIRGELLRRFPDTMVVAMRARAGSVPPVFEDDSEAEILFHARLDPDFTVVGFGLTEAEVRDPARNWWIVLAQNPTAPRFGPSALPSPEPEGATIRRDQLDWLDFGNVPPGGFLPLSRQLRVSDPDSRPVQVTLPGHAGITARVLLSNPLRAAFRASDLIGAIRTTP